MNTTTGRQAANVDSVVIHERLIEDKRRVSKEYNLFWINEPIIVTETFQTMAQARQKRVNTMLNIPISRAKLCVNVRTENSTALAHVLCHLRQHGLQTRLESTKLVEMKMKIISGCISEIRMICRIHL